MRRMWPFFVKGKKKKCSNSGEMLDMDMRNVATMQSISQIKRIRKKDKTTIVVLVEVE